MRDEVVWDDEERDDVMSLDMNDRVMGYQSFQGASTPAYVSSNVWKNGRRKGSKALGSSRLFRPQHSARQLHAPVGFQAWLPYPCHSAAAMHPPTACLCERNWSVWGQMCTKHLLKACLGACTEANLHLLQHKDLSVSDLESSLQLQTRWKKAKDWAARLIRVELRGEEPVGRGRNSLWLIPASGRPDPVKIIHF